MSRFVHRLFTLLRWLLTGECGYACGIAAPFGFVPEAGCPIHDIENDGRYQCPPTYPYREAK